MNERNHQKSGGAGLRMLAAAAMALLLTGCAQPQTPQTTAPAAATTVPMEPAGTASVREELDISLGQGLRLLRMDRYAGIYMEDGSNDVVTDVMMLIVENTAPEDLQLARIDVEFGDQTLWFEVTNLPSGGKAVLLEKERRALPAQEPGAAAVRNVVFFREPMALEEGLEVSGGDGLLKLTNTTGEAIPGPISVFYKYSSGDLLYGGITFRVLLDRGLDAGETAAVPAGHFSPETCRVLQIRRGE